MGTADLGGLTVSDGPTFYIDASMHVRLYRALRIVQAPVSYPGQHGCMIEPGSKDTVWMPLVANEGWPVITRDKKIRTRPDERAKFIEHGLKGFCLTSGGQRSAWWALQVVVKHWERMVELVDTQPGPFIYSVTPTGGIRGLYLKKDHLAR